MIRKSVLNMQGYVPGEQPKSLDIIKLNTNENPYPPSQSVAQALLKVDASLLRLYPDPISTGLRNVIADLHKCNEDQVFVGNGSDEVLSLCTRAFVENNGSIGYFEPSYSLYSVLADIRDVEKKPLALGNEFEWLMPDNYTASIFFLTRPNAPTGILYSKNVVRAFCEKFPGVVVIDEAYADFADDNCADLALELPNVIIIRTLSKAYSLAGIRVGYAVGSASLINAMMTIKDSYNLNKLSQNIAKAALLDGDSMRRNVEKIRSTRSRLSSALIDMSYVVYPSNSNFVWVKPNDDACKLFEMLKKYGIFVRYFPGEKTRAYLRITVGTDEEIDRLLEVLKENNRAS